MCADINNNGPHDLWKGVRLSNASSNKLPRGCVLPERSDNEQYRSTPY
jgi:hypothetical protein